MQIVYMNDEKKNITVRILDADYKPEGDNSHTYHVLRPCELKIFEINLPPNSAPYIKKWTDMVMITYIDLSVISQLQQQLLDLALVQVD